MFEGKSTETNSKHIPESFPKLLLGDNVGNELCRTCWLKLLEYLVGTSCVVIDAAYDRTRTEIVPSDVSD